MRVEPVAHDELLTSILATVPVGILVVDPVSLRIVSANGHAQRLLDPKWHDRGLVGQDFVAVFPASGDMVRQIVHRVAELGESVHVANRPFTGFARGLTYWDADITPVRDADGVCTAILFNFVETTANVLAQRELEETNRELATLSALSAMVVESLDFDAVVDRVLAAIAALIPHDRAFLMLEADAAHLRVVAARGDDTQAPGQVGMLVPKQGSVNGWVFSHRTSYHTADLRAPNTDVPGYIPPQRDPRLRAAMCVPLVARGQAIGTLYLARFETGAYADRDIARLEMFAPQAAAAIANARLYRETTERATELATLNEVTIALAGSLAIEDVLDRILHEIRRAVPYDSAFVALPNDARTSLRVVGVAGNRRIHEVGTELRMEHSIAGRVFREDRAILLSDLSQAEEWRDLAIRRYGTTAALQRSLLVVPLRALDEPIGVLFLTRDYVGAYDDADRERLLRFTPAMSVAVTNARLYARSVEQVAAQQRLNAELETLRDVGIAITGTLDLADLLRRVLAEIARVVPYEQGAINLDVPGRDTLRVEVAVGHAMEQLAGTEVSLTTSLNGYAYREGTTVCVDDFWASEWLNRSHRFNVGPDALRSILCAPLRVGGESIGTLYLAHSQPARYHTDDVARIERYANQVAVAVANARLYAQVRQQVDELQTLNADLQTLHDLGLAINTSLDLDAVLPRALDEIKRLIPAEAGYVVLTEPDGETLRIATAFGFMAGRAGGRIPIEGSINGAIIRAGETLWIRDLSADATWVGREHRPVGDVAAYNLRSILGVPLVVAGAVIGTVYLAHREPNMFVERDVARLERYAAPLAVAVANARLYEQIQLQVDELRRLNDDLAQANRHKSEFLATMSHELRTPLNAIIGFSELLADDVVITPADRQQCLQDILTSATHLLSLINDVLDVAKIESGKMEMRPVLFDVREELAEAERLMGPLVAARRQTLTITVALEVVSRESGVVSGGDEKAGSARLTTDDSQLLVYADRDRFRQVILNVLSNANKFTPDGGSITVMCDAVVSRESGVVRGGEQRTRDPRLTTDDSRPSYIRVRVTDTGIGIRPEDAHKVFEEFRQIDGSLSRQYGGTGLGLALSKRLIEMQGGTISFASTHGTGTTFTITVPSGESGSREIGAPLGTNR
jgi:GAF domain-containing protein